MSRNRDASNYWVEHQRADWITGMQAAKMVGDWAIVVPVEVEPPVGVITQSLKPSATQVVIQYEPGQSLYL